MTEVAAQKPDRRSPAQRNHEDLGAINARIDGAEKGIEGLSRKLDNSVDRLSEKIDALATAFGNSRATELAPLIGTGVTVAAVVGSLLWAFLSPVATQTTTNENDLKLILQTRFTRDDAAALESKFNARFSMMETKENAAEEFKRVDEVRASELKRIDEKIAIYHSQAVIDLGRIDAQLSLIEHDFERRDEGEKADANNAASLERVSRNLENLRTSLGADLTVGDAIKSLERRVESMQAERRYWPQADSPPPAIVPIVPTPIAPPAR